MERGGRTPLETTGRLLFFDTILSANGKVSCATCHQPAKGFTSGGLAPKLGGGTLARRAPSLWDRGAGTRFFWDGRATSLESQALDVMNNPQEMGSLRDAVDRAVAKYPQVKSADDIARALAAFERSLESPGNRWDEYVSGENSLSLTPAEARGWNLFRGKAECYRCHTGRLFTDEQLHDTGLGGKFKTPGLRGLIKTAPYMHDASLKTLRDVVDHYDRGGGEAKRLGLSPQEKADLEAFLKSL